MRGACTVSVGSIRQTIRAASASKQRVSATMRALTASSADISPALERNAERSFPMLQSPPYSPLQSLSGSLIGESPVLRKETKKPPHGRLGDLPPGTYRDRGVSQNGKRDGNHSARRAAGRFAIYVDKLLKKCGFAVESRTLAQYRRWLA